MARYSNTTLIEPKVLWNNFTRALADQLLNGPVEVQLRNGKRMTVCEYSRIDCCFFSTDYRYAWNQEGVSCSGSDYDILYFNT